MQKKIGMLAVLLAAQLVLAVAMSFTGPSLTAHQPDTPLLAANLGAPDRLTLEDADKQKLVLARKADGWILPDNGDFPADTAKVNRLLDELKGLKRGLAVATTESAQKRFKVSDEAFERRITLALNDKTLATLYLGSSPGMHQVSARTAKDKAVYDTDFGVYDVPVKAQDWEDKDILKLAPAQIASIDLGGITLSRVAEKPAAAATARADQPETASPPAWTADGLQDGQTLNQSGADTLAQTLAALTIDSVIGRESKPDYGLDKPTLTLNLKRADGSSIEYLLGKRDKTADFVLKVSTRPEYFRLPGATGNALVKAAGREQLVANLSAGTSDSNATTPVPASGTGAAGTTGAGKGTSKGG